MAHVWVAEWKPDGGDWTWVESVAGKPTIRATRAEARTVIAGIKTLAILARYPWRPAKYVREDPAQ